MTTLSMDELERRFVDWAQAEEDVRAAFVVGSRARLDHPADAWSDLDIIMFADHVEQYRDSIDWIVKMAPIWVSIFGITAGNDPERLVLFEGGFQVDFVFHDRGVLQVLQDAIAAHTLPDIIYRGIRVLVDKDNVLSGLPAPGRPPSPPPPDAGAFKQNCDAFWFTAVHVAKQVRRGELWRAHMSSSGLYGLLQQMVTWHAQARYGCDHDIWHAGRFIAEWAPPEVYAELRQIPARLELEDARRGLLTAVRLHHAMAHEVAQVLGHDASDALVSEMLLFVEELLNT